MTPDKELEIAKLKDLCRAACKEREEWEASCNHKKPNGRSQLIGQMVGSEVFFLCQKCGKTWPHGEFPPDDLIPYSENSMGGRVTTHAADLGELLEAGMISDEAFGLYLADFRDRYRKHPEPYWLPLAQTLQHQIISGGGVGEIAQTADKLVELLTARVKEIETEELSK